MIKKLIILKINIKIEKVNLVASLLNSSYIEQNSRIIQQLIDQTKDESNLDRVSGQIFSKILIEMVYDDWRELYEQTSSNRPLDDPHLIEVLKSRLCSREASNKALTTLLDLFSVSNSNKHAKILNSLKYINNFNSSVLSAVVNQTNVTEYTMSQVSGLSQVLNDLVKRSYDEEMVSYQVESGVLHSVCELVEIIWNLIDFITKGRENIELDINLCRITLDAFILVKNLNKPDLITSRFYLITAIYNCFNRSLQVKRKSDQDENLKSCNDTLSRLITCLLRTLYSNKKAIQRLEQVDLIGLLIEYALLSSQQLATDSALLKSILLCLINFSSQSMKNRAKVCKANDSFVLINVILRLVLRNDEEELTDNKVVELGMALLRTLASYVSVDATLRDKLRECGLYSVLLDHSLASSNLRIVASACSILWTLTGCRNRPDEEMMIKLGAECKLRALTNSSNHLISMASLATIKNLYLAINESRNTDCQGVFITSKLLFLIQFIKIQI